MYSVARSSGDPYLLLAAAIIQQVVDDYIRAIRKDNVQMQEDCERWFNSDYYKVYSMGLSPDAVIRQCHKIAKKERKRNGK